MSQRLLWHVWEGIYTADFTLEAVYRRCRRIGAALAQRQVSCLVAHDTRFLAGQFARFAYRTLEAQGVRLGFCPSPMALPAVELALAQRRSDCALVVAAGNRPHWYSGLMLLAPAGDAALLEPAPPASDEALPPFPPPPLDTSEQTQIDLRAPYVELLRDTVDVDLIRRSSLTVFVDPMHGGAIGYLPAVIGEGSQTKAIEINRETDPLFGRQTPLPSETGMPRLRKLVKESDSHLGVAIAADGRALGVTDNQGEQVAPHEVALLLALYLSRQHRQRGTVVLPLPADDGAGLRNWEQSTGLRVEAVSDPGARIAELAAQDRHSLLAGTTATGELTLGRYNASPDATLAALVLVELVARSGGKLRAQLEDLRARMSTAG
ncbi:MAG TPA: phosphoglucomutase [Roseiflexaceae bacterium]|nr:phosphoglucomutase [Roseiflexaceae bacterium]